MGEPILREKKRMISFIASLAERLTNQFAVPLVKDYQTILGYDLSEEVLPSREEVWPMPRLAKVYFPFVYFDFRGSPEIPRSTVRMALKDLIPEKERKEIGLAYRYWNGLLVARESFARSSSEERAASARVAAAASLKARGMRSWGEEELARVFSLAESDDPQFKYHGGVSLKAIAEVVGRTPMAVRTCLKNHKR